MQANGHMETVVLNIHLFTARSSTLGTNAKAVCMFMPCRQKHIYNEKAVNLPKERGL